MQKYRYNQSNPRKLTQEQAEERLIQAANNRYTFKPFTYEGCYTQIECVCSKNPDHIWSTQFCNLTGKLNTSCPYCSGRGIKNNNGRPKVYTVEYCNKKLEELSKQKNYTFQPLTEVKNLCVTRTTCKCNECGNEWNSNLDSLISKQTGCKYCGLKNYSGRSPQEDEIEWILKSIIPGELILRNERMLKAEYCRNKTEVDIYLPNLKIGFEVNDKSHTNAEAKRRSNGYCSTVTEWHESKTKYLKNQYNSTLIHIDVSQWNLMGYLDKYKYLKSIIERLTNNA